jgi:gas vesicle protein
MGKKLAFLIGLFVGGFLGWVLGLLSAPASGKETLDTLGEKAIELRDRAEQAADRVKEEVLKPLSSTENLDADYTR